MRNFRLTRTNVLVKRQEAETQTKGGILLPDNVRPSPLQGTIMKLGLGCNVTSDVIDGKCHWNKTFSVGDVVLFDPFAGVEVVLDNEPFLIMDEADILVIFPKEKEYTNARPE